MIVMLLALLLVVGSRVWRLDVPFERDEGEYAYMGQLMLQGVPPYSAAANMKLPGTYASYALIMSLFGQTIRGVHLGYLLVNLGCIVLLYFVARRLHGSMSGIAAAASYAVLSVGWSVDGLWAHATHFVVLFALAAILLLLTWSERPAVGTLLGSGLLFGMAFLMKQPGGLFAVFGGCYVAYCCRKAWREMARDVALFTAAVCVPFGITCVILWRMGVFDRFWFWVFGYAAQYVSSKSLSEGLSACLRSGFDIVQTNPLLTILAAAGFFLLWTRQELRPSKVFLSGFLVFSWLAVCPGLYFRPHYFVLVLPAVGLLIGGFARTFGARSLWAVAAGLAVSIALQWGYLYQADATTVMRDVYQSNPFPEAVQVAAYVRAHTATSDRIVVLGSEPEIYFYSGRRSAIPYLYVDALVNEHSLVEQMYQEYIAGIESSNPKYLVFASFPPAWGLALGQPSPLLAWAQDYYRQYYERVGIADITEDGTIYKWDGDAARYRIESGEYVLVLRRKQDERGQ